MEKLEIWDPVDLLAQWDHLVLRACRDAWVNMDRMAYQGLPVLKEGKEPKECAAQMVDQDGQVYVDGAEGKDRKGSQVTVAIRDFLETTDEMVNRVWMEDQVLRDTQDLAAPRGRMVKMVYLESPVKKEKWVYQEKEALLV